jgi:hypothetical protein
MRQTGYDALIRSLGYADAIRFLNQFYPGQGNYIEWQDGAFGDIEAGVLYDQAERRWKTSQG